MDDNKQTQKNIMIDLHNKVADHLLKENIVGVCDGCSESIIYEGQEIYKLKNLKEDIILNFEFCSKECLEECRKEHSFLKKLNFEKTIAEYSNTSLFTIFKNIAIFKIKNIWTITWSSISLYEFIYNLYNKDEKKLNKWEKNNKDRFLNDCFRYKIVDKNIIDTKLN